jgi:DNA replication protein DnaC
MPRRKQPPDPDDVIERIRRHLEFLGLRHTLESLDDYLAWVTREKPAASVLLERILGQEAAFKLERRIEWRIGKSGLREHKTLEAFDWAFQPGLDRALVMELAGMQFVRRKEDLVVTGKSGTGKSHILQALGLRACQQQFSVRYARCVDLLDDLYAGLADTTYPARLKRWAAPDLLIIDDVGLGQVKKRDDEPTAAHTLFNLIDRRHG